MAGNYVNGRPTSINYRQKNYNYILPNSSFEDIMEASLPELRTKPEYQGCSDADIISDVLSKIQIKNAKLVSSHYKILNQINPRPDVPGWGEYTYEEILNMHDNGVNVPDEVLEWARAEANEDVVNYQVDSDDISNSTDLAQMESDLNDDRTVSSKKNVVLYSEKSEIQSEKMQKKYQELNDKSSALNKKQTAVSASKQTSLNKIAAYKKEYETLEQKIRNGEELSTNEQLRYRSLSGKIENESKNVSYSNNDLQAEIDLLYNSIDKTESLAAINERIAAELDLKNQTFVSIESKSNNGTLPLINKNIGVSNNPYLYMALSGQLYTNVIDLVSDINLDKDISLNKSENSKNNITGIKDFESMSDKNISDVQDNSVIESEDTSLPNEDEKVNVSDNTEIPDDTNTLSENTQNTQFVENEEPAQDVSGNTTQENSIDKPEENNTLTEQNGKLVAQSVNTEYLPNDNKEIDNNVDINNTTNDNTVSEAIDNETNVAARQEDLTSENVNNQMPENSSSIEDVQNGDKQNNETSETLESDTQTLENIQNDQDKHSEKVLPEKNEQLKDAMKRITIPNSQEKSNETGNNLKEVASSIAKALPAYNLQSEKSENLTPEDDSKTIQQKESPENTEFFDATNLSNNESGKINNDTITDLETITSKTNDSNNKSPEKKNQKTFNDTKIQPTAGLSQTINENASNTPVTSEKMDNNRQVDMNNVTNTASKEINKNTPSVEEKSSPKTTEVEKEESLEIQLESLQRTNISDEEIFAATGNIEEINNNTEEVQQVVTEQINDSKPEYLKNPMLVDNTEQVSEDISVSIAEEAKVVEKQNLTKEEPTQKIKESVKETMQATLSSVNQKVQSKDSDKDKKHKMFTRFEIEKQDAIRKTVQKISNAKDAR